MHVGRSLNERKMAFEGNEYVKEFEYTALLFTQLCG